MAGMVAFGIARNLDVGYGVDGLCTVSAGSVPSWVEPRMLVPPDVTPWRCVGGQVVIRHLPESGTVETTVLRLREVWNRVGGEWETGVQAPPFDFATGRPACFYVRGAGGGAQPESRRSPGAR